MYALVAEKAPCTVIDCAASQDEVGLALSRLLKAGYLHRDAQGVFFLREEQAGPRRKRAKIG